MPLCQNYRLVYQEKLVLSSNIKSLASPLVDCISFVLDIVDAQCWTLSAILERVRGRGRESESESESVVLFGFCLCTV